MSSTVNRANGTGLIEQGDVRSIPRLDPVKEGYGYRSNLNPEQINAYFQSKIKADKEGKEKQEIINTFRERFINPDNKRFIYTAYIDKSGSKGTLTVNEFIPDIVIHCHLTNNVFSGRLACDTLNKPKYPLNKPEEYEYFRVGSQLSDANGETKIIMFDFDSHRLYSKENIVIPKPYTQAELDELTTKGKKGNRPHQYKLEQERKKEIVNAKKEALKLIQPYLDADAEKIINKLAVEFNCYKEISVSGGVHLWVFLDQAVSVAAMQTYVQDKIKGLELNQTVEIYPKAENSKTNNCYLPTQLITPDGVELPLDDIDSYEELKNSPIGCMGIQELAAKLPAKKISKAKASKPKSSSSVPDDKKTAFFQELKQAALFTPDSFERHNNIKPFLNLADEVGMKQEMADFLGTREIYDKWGLAKDGTRTPEKWAKEVLDWLDQPAPLNENGQPKLKGIPALVDAGFDVGYLAILHRELRLSFTSDGFVLPKRYRYSEEGVLEKYVRTEGKDEAETDIYSVIYNGSINVLNVSNDYETNKQSLTIKFSVGNGYRILTAPREELAQARSFLKLAASIGAEVHEDNARDLSVFISKFVSLNTDKFKESTAAPHYGYTGKSILGANWSVGEQAVFSGDRIIKTKEDKSLLPAAVKQLIKLKAYPALLALAMAAISPHLPRIGVRRNPVLAFIGRSNSGKSTAVQLALSLYGDPSIAPLAVQGSISTKKGFAQTASFTRGLPFFIDEIHTLDKPSVLMNTVYSFANKQLYTRGSISGSPDGGNELMGALFLAGEEMPRFENQGLVNRVLFLKTDNHEPLGSGGGKDAQMLQDAAQHGAGAWGYDVTKALWGKDVKSLVKGLERSLNESSDWIKLFCVAQVGLNTLVETLELNLSAAEQTVISDVLPAAMAIQQAVINELDIAEVALDDLRAWLAGLNYSTPNSYPPSENAPEQPQFRDNFKNLCAFVKGKSTELVLTHRKLFDEVLTKHTEHEILSAWADKNYLVTQGKQRKKVHRFPNGVTARALTLHYDAVFNKEAEETK